MEQGTPGTPPAKATSINLDSFTICVAFGAVLIVAGVLEAIHDLSDGGDYAFWYALEDLFYVGAVGVLVLLCAVQLGTSNWAPSLRRAAPALGAAVVVASTAIAIRDLTGDFSDPFWVALDDLFFYVPVVLGVVVYLSAVQRADRVLGGPMGWARIVAVVALVFGLIIATHDFSDASSDDVWVFLSSFAEATGYALFLLAASLEPRASMTRVASGSNITDWLNDARLPNWIAIGGVAVVVAGVLLGLKSLDAPSDGFWLLLQNVGFYLGLGCVVLIASGGEVGTYIRGNHPYVRYALIGALIAMFLAGIKFTADADTDQFWVFINDAIEYLAFPALGFAMFEASQRSIRSGGA
jgi:uncharacterized membrane protein HdeD (DUF308 family)